MSDTDKPRCGICQQPMPEGEEMFKFHGYSGGCPTPPVHPRQAEILKNNYRVFQRRAREAACPKWRAENMTNAMEAARDYLAITGKVLG